MDVGQSRARDSRATETVNDIRRCPCGVNWIGLCSFTSVHLILARGIGKAMRVVLSSSRASTI